MQKLWKPEGILKSVCLAPGSYPANICGIGSWREICGRSGTKQTGPKERYFGLCLCLLPSIIYSVRTWNCPYIAYLLTHRSWEVIWSLQISGQSQLNNCVLSRGIIKTVNHSELACCEPRAGSSKWECGQLPVFLRCHFFPPPCKCSFWPLQA